MKINTNQILPEGLCLQEEVAASAFDLETEIVKFSRPILIIARISRITNAVSADILLKYSIRAACGRCLSEFETEQEKKLRLNYAINKLDPVVDLGPDIREEIILDYPLKPLCNCDCKGLCPRCGKNLNEGECGCK